MQFRQLCQSSADIALLVFKADLVQGVPFTHGSSPVRNTWVREHFQLTSAKVQANLKRYLQMPQIQMEMPKDVSTEAAQLSWMTELATQAFSDWVDSLLSALAHYKIASGHQQVNTAAEVVETFRHSQPNKPDQLGKPAGKKRSRPGALCLL